MRLALPLDLPCGVTLPNRLAKSAMSERIADAGGHPGERLQRLYRRWGQGGAGLLITGNVMVDRTAIAESGNVVVDGDTPLGLLKAWAAAAGPAPTWVQINHPGRQAPRLTSARPVAPSDVPMQGYFGMFARPRVLTALEIREIIDRFGRTAALVQAAGFAGVQIHAAHGYLISQFLSPRTNLRTDEWGGSPENRRRFLLEVVRAVRAAVGPDFPVGVKLNSADFQRGGFDQAESMAAVDALDALGIDLLEVSGGTYEAAAMFAENPAPGESTRKREAFFLEYAEQVRARTSLPLMVTGGFRTAAAMDEALASGAVDLIGMARPFAVAPELPRLLLDGSLAGAPPVRRLSTGLKSLDAMIQGAWYQMQLRRLGNGLDPDPSLGRFRALVGYVAPPAPAEPKALPA